MTVNVTVNPVNDAPVAAAAPLIVTEDNPGLNGTVTATDKDGDTVIISKSSEPANGSVVVNADGTYTYTPNADDNGPDSLTCSPMTRTAGRIPTRSNGYGATVE